MSKFFDGLEKYIYWTSIPKIGLNDIVDILIVSVMIYLIVKWIKTTRAWVLLKGIIILLCIAFAAYLLQLHTVSWILSNTMSVGITAILIVFQPELRSALEQLGRKNWVTDISLQIAVRKNWNIQQELCKRYQEQRLRWER